ncbi:MAG: hypothetical protein WBD40_18300 [Tepidisphaeraceae bacterium]
MKSCVIGWAVLFGAVGCAASDAKAQETSQTPQAPVPAPGESPAPAQNPNGNALPPAPGVSIDEVLDALDRQGDELKDFTADVALTEMDDFTKDAFTREGTLRLQKESEGDARIYIIFETRKTDAKTTKEKIEFLLDDGWLTERHHRQQKNTRRQVLKPGEKINLLKLGEGPFPLPIGQDKEDVKGMFEVEVIPAAPEDPAGTIHGRLKPRPQTQFERKFTSIDVWVDPKAQMPRRIETLDRNGQIRQTTDLTNVKTNAGLNDDAFKLPPVNAKDGWKLLDEPYQE